MLSIVEEFKMLYEMGQQCIRMILIKMDILIKMITISKLIDSGMRRVLRIRQIAVLFRQIMEGI